MSVTKLTSKKFDSMWESTVDPTTLSATKFAIGDEILFEGKRYLVTKDGITAPVANVGYSVYTALISQTGTSAPTVIVLENTLGAAIVWSYSAVGQYLGTLTGAFTADKTAFIANNQNNQGTAMLLMYRNSANEIQLDTVNVADGSGLNGSLDKNTIEIRVYA